MSQNQPSLGQSQLQQLQNQPPLPQKPLRNQLRSQRRERPLREAHLPRRMRNLSRSQPRNLFQPKGASDPRLHQLPQEKHDLSQRLLLVQLVRHLSENQLRRPRLQPKPELLRQPIPPRPSRRQGRALQLRTVPLR